MRLSEVIKALQELEELHGSDVLVFVNGEHGEQEPELARREHFAVGEAELTLGGDAGKLPFGIRQRDTIMQIGGY
jgi:hypothetical protein